MWFIIVLAGQYPKIYNPGTSEYLLALCPRCGRAVQDTAFDAEWGTLDSQAWTEYVCSFSSSSAYNALTHRAISKNIEGAYKQGRAILYKSLF